MRGVEALDFAKLNLGVLGPVHGTVGNPPVGAWQAGGQAPDRG